MIQQRERLLDLSDEVLGETVGEFCGPHAEEWDLEGLSDAIKQRFGFEANVKKSVATSAELSESIWLDLEKIVEAREAEFGLPVLMYFARHFLLEEIDQRWIEHLRSMDHLREGIGLRGYGQRDPKQEYKKEGFAIFGMMMANISRNLCEKVYRMQLVQKGAEAQVPRPATATPAQTVESGGAGTGAKASSDQASEAQDAKDAPKKRPRFAATNPRSAAMIPVPVAAARKYKKCAVARVRFKTAPFTGRARSLGKKLRALGPKTSQCFLCSVRKSGQTAMTTGIGKCNQCRPASGRPWPTSATGGASENRTSPTKLIAMVPNAVALTRRGTTRWWRNFAQRRAEVGGRTATGETEGNCGRTPQRANNIKGVVGSTGNTVPRAPGQKTAPKPEKKRHAEQEVNQRRTNSPGKPVSEALFGAGGSGSASSFGEEEPSAEAA